MLCPPVVLVLQFHKTFRSVLVKVYEGEYGYDLSRYQNWGIIQEWSRFYTTGITDEQSSGTELSHDPGKSRTGSGLLKQGQMHRKFKN